jgi:hypothetical protein
LDGNIISADKDVDGGSESRKKYGQQQEVGSYVPMVMPE